MRTFIIIVLLTSTIFVSAQSRKERFRRLVSQGDSIEQMVGDIQQKDSILLSENLQLAKNQYAMASLISAQSRIVNYQQSKIDSLEDTARWLNDRLEILERAYYMPNEKPIKRRNEKADTWMPPDQHYSWGRNRAGPDQ